MKKSKYFLRVYKTLLLFAVSFFSFSTFANTNLIFENSETGQCLDSDGYNIVTRKCSGKIGQTWVLQDDGVIHNRADANQYRPCLDSNEAGNVYVNACNGGPYQKWVPSFGVLFNYRTGLALEGNYSGAVFANKWNNNNAAQYWIGKQIGPSSGCPDFQVKANGVCVPAGYSKCPTYGHWDSAVRGVGGCACDTGYNWDGSKCVASKAVSEGVSKDSYGTIKVCEHSNFQGKCKDYLVGYYDTLEMNDQISSVEVGPGLRVILYEHSNYKGAKKGFRGSNGYVGADFNDKASSMIVEQDFPDVEG